MTYFYLIKIVSFFFFFFLLKKFFFWGDAPHGMQDLIPQTRDQPMPPTLEVQSLNQWAAREVLKCLVIHSF